MTLVDGEYEATVAQWALVETKPRDGQVNGDPRVKVVFDVPLEGGGSERIEFNGSLEDMQIPNQRYGKQETWLEATFKALRTIGWTGTKIGELNTIAPPDGAVRIKVVTKIGNDGKSRQNAYVLQNTDARRFAMSPDRTRAIEARLSQRFAGLDAKLGKIDAAPRTAPRLAPRAATQARPPAAYDGFDDPQSFQGGGDDVPFD